ncbi:hypothetical protein [Citrobacter cronae]|uniref:hypothetical protein n=1 Tax=Citrobacter cronae TaxID=1748967 RepID=UPI00388DB45B
MGSNIIELAKLGHERADELKAECGAVDVRSVAQLISDLASQLDVQYVRAEESQREFLAADITMQNLEAKCAALAAENAGLNKFITQSCYVFDGEQHEISDAYICATDGGMPKTPATDAFLAEVRAQESAPLVLALTVIANSEQHDGETVVCDFDTLISVAAGALKDHYAAKLRKGVQS